MTTRVRPSAGELAVVHDDDSIRIALSGNPDDPGVILCFTGVGRGVGGVQVEEFVGSTRLPGYFAIYITDKKRSWYNLDPRLILDILDPYIEGKSVVTIGNSMGGFGAVWMSGVLGNVRTCLAFAAQYSVHPEIVPNERRWAKYRAEIREWRVPSLLTSFAVKTRFWTFNGGRDSEHWSKFPQGDNLTHFLAKDAGHDVARTLKDAGVLSDVIKDCIDGNDPFQRMVEAGAEIERIAPGTVAAGTAPARSRPAKRTAGSSEQSVEEKRARRLRRQARKARNAQATAEAATKRARRRKRETQP